jgi:cytochrome c oxidase cbb3-type subunit IV
MDVNDLRSLVTVVSLVLFIGIVRWAWARSNQGAFAEAANLPFEESAAPLGATGPQPTPEVNRTGDAGHTVNPGSRP